MGIKFLQRLGRWWRPSHCRGNAGRRRKKSPQLYGRLLEEIPTPKAHERMRNEWNACLEVAYLGTFFSAILQSVYAGCDLVCAFCDDFESSTNRNHDLLEKARGEGGLYLLTSEAPSAKRQRRLSK